jgi:thioredoxin 1
MAKELTEATFDKTISDAVIPVLVDFWAPWCGPCRAIGPIVEELANEYSGKLEVYKVNVDEQPALPAKFSIQSIPTLLVFNKNEVQERITGNVPKEQLKNALDKVLS